MARKIPNYKINAKLVEHEEFVNYNSTIMARRTDEGTYEVWHWNTKIFEYDYTNKRVVFLRFDYISQTTSTLIGRIIRSLPVEVVMGMVEDFAEDKKQQRRLLSMSGILRRHF